MELLILAHAPTRNLELGFLPAAAQLQLKVTILTDCAREHIARAQASAPYAGCDVAECDVFNPLAVARFLAVHGQHIAGVLAADAALHACAAVSAAYLQLAGAAWRNAVLHDQRLQPGGLPAGRRVADCAHASGARVADCFPLAVGPLEGGAAAGGVIVHNPAELERRLADLRHGYALLEPHREDEAVYALDALVTAQGFAILAGSRIAFDQDAVRTKRVHTYMLRPPRCEELLSLLLARDLGHGRHHVEYGISSAGLRIREIHNGLHDDESEFALADQLDGDLFGAVLKASLGMPVVPPRLRQAGTLPAPELGVAA